MKTTNDILSNVYKIIKASPIDALNGGIYRQTRQTDSELNDCVFHLIGGTTHKFLQNGALYVKIFCNDLFINNTYSQDFEATGNFESLLYDLSETLIKYNAYSFDIQSREIYSEALQEKHEHYSILKINFKILNK